MHKTGQRIKRQPNAAVSGKTCAGSFSGKKYRKENNTSSTWEITLFCVDPNVKGTGVGGILFSHALQFFKEQHAKNYFLATDDDCDVNFYKHQGLSCVDEAPIQTSDKNFGSAYIYAGEL